MAYPTPPSFWPKEHQVKRVLSKPQTNPHTHTDIGSTRSIPPSNMDPDVRGSLQNEDGPNQDPKRQVPCCGWTTSCTTQEPIGDHCSLVFTGESSFPTFVRWCRISSIHSVLLGCEANLSGPLLAKLDARSASETRPLASRSAPMKLEGSQGAQVDRQHSDHK